MSRKEIVNRNDNHDRNLKIAVGVLGVGAAAALCYLGAYRGAKSAIGSVEFIFTSPDGTEKATREE